MRFSFIQLIFATSIIELCLGCSGVAVSSAKMNAAGLVVMSSGDSFKILSNLPKTGNGSLAALYANLGSMSFAKFYHYLDSRTLDGQAMIDGHLVSNPKQALQSEEASFTKLGMSYATVSDWWEATGSKPGPLGTYDDYKAQLDHVLGDNTSLGLVRGCSSTLGSLAPTALKALFGRQSIIFTRSLNPANLQSASTVATALPEGEPVQGANEATNEALNSGEGLPAYPGWEWEGDVKMSTSLPKGDGLYQVPDPADVTPPRSTIAISNGRWVPTSACPTSSTGQSKPNTGF